MNFINQRILMLGPHTDDVEFGCGATIVKLFEKKNEIFCHAFSSAEESVPQNLPSNINRQYMFDSLHHLGLDTKNISIGSYPVRLFSNFRQKILDDMIYLAKEIKPDIIFIPSTFDTHQDHQVISQEGFRAFKKFILLGYEIPWNNLTFRTDAFSIVNHKQVKLKIEALQCYISQLGRNYITPSYIYSVAKTRGGQVGKEFAEVFEVIRLIF